MSIKKIARNKHGDALYAVLGPLAHRIVSEDWDVYAKQTEYARLRRGEKTGAALVTYSLLKPSIMQGFASATIASACMTETTLFRLWPAMGVEMKPVGEGLRKDLRYTRHEHGDRITIYYASHETWSKRYRDRAATDAIGVETRLLDQIRRAIVALLGGEPFVWMGNKDLDDGFFGVAGAERLPNTPHGLNSFQSYHVVVVLSALNPPPAHFHFMETFGVSSDELRTGCYRTAVYQAVMRGSIRNPDDATPKTVVVMDRDTAEWLADLFPGAAVKSLPGLGALPSKGKAGRPRQHADAASRTRTYRAEQERKYLAQLDLINGTSFVLASYPLLAEQVRGEMREFVRDEIPSYGGDFVTAPAAPAATCGTAYLSIYDSMPFEHFVHFDDDGFIAELRDLHARRALKAEGGLFSPAHFDPTKATDTDRGLDNIIHLRGLWLDNDGGDLTHAAFADLFPFLRIVVWNTASSTAAAPRWRAFVPTNCAYSLDLQALILGQIVKVLNRAGYWGARQIAKQSKRLSAPPRLRHGFDEGKMNGAAMFFLPVQAKDPKDSFFTDYGEADPQRGPLDLHAWIEHCILDLRPEPEPARPENVVSLAVPATLATQAPKPVADQKRRVCARLQALRDAMAARDARPEVARRAVWIEKAIQDWRLTPRGSGHNAFFKLGAALHRAGLNASEIQDRLWEEAAYATSTRERRAEIKDILRSLCRRGTMAGSGRSTRNWWD